jgi:hypothetical protein
MKPAIWFVLILTVWRVSVLLCRSEGMPALSKHGQHVMSRGVAAHRLFCPLKIERKSFGDAKLSANGCEIYLFSLVEQSK